MQRAACAAPVAHARGLRAQGRADRLELGVDGEPALLGLGKPGGELCGAARRRLDFVAAARRVRRRVGKPRIQRVLVALQIRHDGLELRCFLEQRPAGARATRASRRMRHRAARGAARAHRAPSEHPRASADRAGARARRDSRRRRRRTAVALPSATSRRLSQTVRSSARSCDTSTRLPSNPASARVSAWRISRSRWLVGSSSSSRFGRRRTISASARRDFSPPENGPTGASAISPRKSKPPRKLRRSCSRACGSRPQRDARAATPPRRSCSSWCCAK